MWFSENFGKRNVFCFAIKNKLTFFAYFPGWDNKLKKVSLQNQANFMQYDRKRKQGKSYTCNCKASG